MISNNLSVNKQNTTQGKNQAIPDDVPPISEVSDKLFVGTYGQSFHFCMRPCSSREAIQPYVTAGGGCLSSKELPNSILVTDEGSIVTRDKFIHVDYIWDSIRAGKRIPMPLYKVYPGIPATRPIEDNSEDNGDKECLPTGRKKGRYAYTQAEDVAILKYIIDTKDYESLYSTELYRTMEMAQVTTHSWESMRERFRRYLACRLLDFREILGEDYARGMDRIKAACKKRNTRGPRNDPPVDLDESTGRLDSSVLENISDQPSPVKDRSPLKRRGELIPIERSEKILAISPTKENQRMSNVPHTLRSDQPECERDLRVVLTPLLSQEMERLTRSRSVGHADRERTTQGDLVATVHVDKENLVRSVWAMEPEKRRSAPQSPSAPLISSQKSSVLRPGSLRKVHPETTQTEVEGQQPEPIESERDVLMKSVWCMDTDNLTEDHINSTTVPDSEDSTVTSACRSLMLEYKLTLLQAALLLYMANGDLADVRIYMETGRRLVGEVPLWKPEDDLEVTSKNKDRIAQIMHRFGDKETKRRISFLSGGRMEEFELGE